MFQTTNQKEKYVLLPRSHSRWSCVQNPLTLTGRSYSLWIEHDRTIRIAKHATQGQKNQTVSGRLFHSCCFKKSNLFVYNTYIILYTYTYIYWLVVFTILKHMSQWEGLSHIHPYTMENKSHV